MSAIIASKADIDVIVTAYLAICGAKGRKLLSADRIGRALWAENVASVESLYAHKPRAELLAMWPQLAEIGAYRHRPIVAKAAGVARILAFYDYQSCEHAAWERSYARKLVKRLERDFPESTPGAERMPWGISNEADLDKVRV